MEPSKVNINVQQDRKGLEPGKTPDQSISLGHRWKVQAGRKFHSLVFNLAHYFSQKSKSTKSDNSPGFLKAKLLSAKKKIHKKITRVALKQNVYKSAQMDKKAALSYEYAQLRGAAIDDKALKHLQKGSILGSKDCMQTLLQVPRDVHVGFIQKLANSDRVPLKARLTACHELGKHFAKQEKLFEAKKYFEKALEFTKTEDRKSVEKELEKVNTQINNLRSVGADLVTNNDIATAVEMLRKKGDIQTSKTLERWSNEGSNGETKCLQWAFINGNESAGDKLIERFKPNKEEMSERLISTGDKFLVKGDFETAKKMYELAARLSNKVVIYAELEQKVRDNPKDKKAAQKLLKLQREPFDPSDMETFSNIRPFLEQITSSRSSSNIPTKNFSNAMYELHEKALLEDAKELIKNSPDKARDLLYEVFTAMDSQEALSMLVRLGNSTEATENKKVSSEKLMKAFKKEPSKKTALALLESDRGDFNVDSALSNSQFLSKVSEYAQGNVGRGVNKKFNSTMLNAHTVATLIDASKTYLSGQTEKAEEFLKDVSILLHNPDLEKLAEADNAIGFLENTVEMLYGTLKNISYDSKTGKAMIGALKDKIQDLHDSLEEKPGEDISSEEFAFVLNLNALLDSLS